jgi:hypothetical protein
MTQEELLLNCWRDLPPAGQAKVLQFTQLLQAQDEDEDFGAPEHLRLKSLGHLENLLQEGLDSADQGEGIEATDAWWESERARLIAKTAHNFNR